MLYMSYIDLKHRAQFQAVDMGSHVSRWERAWGTPGGVASMAKSCKPTRRGRLEAVEMFSLEKRTEENEPLLLQMAELRSAVGNNRKKSYKSPDTDLCNHFNTIKPSG